MQHFYFYSHFSVMNSSVNTKSLFLSNKSKARLWNNLPEEIRLAESVTCFIFYRMMIYYYYFLTQIWGNFRLFVVKHVVTCIEKCYKNIIIIVSVIIIYHSCQLYRLSWQR